MGGEQISTPMAADSTPVATDQAVDLNLEDARPVVSESEQILDAGSCAGCGCGDCGGCGECAGDGACACSSSCGGAACSCG